MDEATTDVEATMLLCDAAQAVGGKLFVLGGGWSILTKRDPTAEMALAVKLAIPWSRANDRIRMEAALITGDGVLVTQNEKPVRAEGNIEVGRPPGLRPGTPLDATFVLNFKALALDLGSYVWELRIDGALAARTPFQVVAPRGAGVS